MRLATPPPRNHWWHVPLYVDVRGLTTRSLHHGDTTFEIATDLVDPSSQCGRSTVALARALVLAFLQSAYEVAAGLAGWDIAAFGSAWCPTAEQLQQLLPSASVDLGGHAS